MSPPTDTPLWTPSPERAAATALNAFRTHAQVAAGRDFADYAQLHRWSVEDPAAFWDLVWDFCGVIGEKGPRRAVELDRMPGSRFFPDARLNFAENLLRRHD